MQALFIGHTDIDVAFQTDRLPVGASSLSFIMPNDGLRAIVRRHGEAAEAARKPLAKFGDHSLATRADRTVERLS
jgi:hypothetical protein